MSYKEKKGLAVNDRNNRSCSTQNMVMGIGSLVVGIVFVILSYRTFLHVALFGAGALLICFGLVKLCVVRNISELGSKVCSLWGTCVAKCKRLWCGCVNCDCDDKENCGCK
jgi:hypothetical protein